MFVQNKVICDSKKIKNYLNKFDNSTYGVNFEQPEICQFWNLDKMNVYLA